jgi:serine protease Do
MVEGHLPFGGRTLLGGAIGSAMLLAATIASAQTIDTSRAAASASRPLGLLHRVADNGARRGPDSFADLVERVQPAVIGVAARVSVQRPESPPGQFFEFGKPHRRAAEENSAPDTPGLDTPDQDDAPELGHTFTIGSGFFVSADGYAITSNHVVENANTAQVRTSDSRTYAAKIVGRDPLSDLALIKVEGRNDFSYVRLADQPPRIGDWVLTAGNAFGLGNAVTAGIVSALERIIDSGSDDGLMQVDAPINKGDSGGPCFNTNGDVVGVNTAIFSPSGGSVGVAFAIPAKTVKTVIAQLKDKGAVVRGYLGVEVQTVTPDIAEGLGAKNARGVVVAGVQNNGPAAKAGLEIGDVITSMNGELIKDTQDLTRKVHGATPGSSVQFGTVQKGKENSLKVTLDQLPAPPRRPGADQGR